MNERICDLRFAICDLGARFRARFPQSENESNGNKSGCCKTLSLTPRFSGVWKPLKRFELSTQARPPI